MCNWWKEYDCKWIPCVVGIILGVGGFAIMWVGVWSWHYSNELQNALTFGGIAIFFIGVACCIYSFFNETCFAYCCKKWKKNDQNNASPSENTSLKDSDQTATV